MKRNASRALRRAVFLLLLMPAAALGPPAMATGPGRAFGKKNIPRMDLAHDGSPPGDNALVLAGAPNLPYNKGAPPG